MKPSRKTQSVYRNQNAHCPRRLRTCRRSPAKSSVSPSTTPSANTSPSSATATATSSNPPSRLRTTPPAVAFLIEQISATARRRKIPKNQIFLGGEDEPAYVANFTAALRAEGYLVVRVNAYEAKENRENLLASTDNLDLLGIAKTLLSRRARLSGDARRQNPAYHHLREITRCRRTLVRQQTAAANRIHALVDQLFPGFLNDSKSGLTPFSDASLELMKERFSAPEIARRKPAALAKLLRRHHVHHPDETAAKIIPLAREALPPAAHRVATLQRTLAATVDLYECLSRNAAELRAEAALTLATTPYAMLTSIPGIGFVLAAGVAGELGDPETSRPHSTPSAPTPASFPRTFQSGGPDSPPVQGHASPPLQPHPQGLDRPKRPENPPLRPARTQGSHHPLERQRPARHLRRRPPLPAPAALPWSKTEIPYLDSRRAAPATPRPTNSPPPPKPPGNVLQSKWRTIPGGTRPHHRRSPSHRLLAACHHGNPRHQPSRPPVNLLSTTNIVVNPFPPTSGHPA